MAYLLQSSFECGFFLLKAEDLYQSKDKKQSQCKTHWTTVHQIWLWQLLACKDCHIRWLWLLCGETSSVTDAVLGIGYKWVTPFFNSFLICAFRLTCAPSCERDRTSPSHKDLASSESCSATVLREVSSWYEHDQKDNQMRTVRLLCFLLLATSHVLNSWWTKTVTCCIKQRLEWGVCQFAMSFK